MIERDPHHALPSSLIPSFSFLMKIVLEQDDCEMQKARQSGLSFKPHGRGGTHAICMVSLHCHQ
jgi:cbb3-type cytochrome oxidase cytochrome c subunit